MTAPLSLILSSCAGVRFYAAGWWVGIVFGLAQLALIGALLMRQRGGHQVLLATA